MGQLMFEDYARLQRLCERQTTALRALNEADEIRKEIRKDLLQKLLVLVEGDYSPETCPPFNIAIRDLVNQIFKLEV